MTPVEILKGARVLIASPSQWTQKAYARDIHCRSIDEQSHEAVCFCSAGAIYRVGLALSMPELNPARVALIAAIDEDSISRWNDAPERTHAEVLAAFDSAIALAEKAGAE